MATIIFKIYEIVKFNKEYKGSSEFNAIDTLYYNGKLLKNLNYICIGEASSDNSFKANKVYACEKIIGKIKSLKSLDKDKKELLISTKEKNIKGYTTFYKTEKNIESFFRGYFEEGNFYCINIYPIQKIKVKISSEPKRCAFNYALKECKVEICEDYLNSVKLDKFKIIGILELIYQNDEITIEGYFKENKYGESFYVLNHNKDISSGTKLIKAYLNKQLHGGNINFNSAKINKIVKHFDTDTLEILEKEPQRLKEVFPKTEDEKILNIKNKVIMSQFIQELYFFCERENIDAKIATKIYDKYGLASIKILKENPYELTDIDSSLFMQADNLAKLNNIEFNDNLRLKSAINYFIKKDAQNNGNVYTDINDIYENLNQFLNIVGAYNTSLIINKSDIDKIITEECIVGNLVKENEKIYLKYNYFYETFIAKKIKELLTDFKLPFVSEEKLDETIENLQKKMKLTKKQKEGVKKALLKNISILTGGPGTGKTLTVRAILQCIKTIKPTAKFKLAAPTGRASQRLSEVTNEPATTIHKLLNITAYQKVNLDSDTPSSLEDLDFLIIDEFSMVDIELFYNILKCLEEKTRLIIIGDYNQLPSVNPGQLLKDLIDSDKVPKTKLKEIFRQNEDSLIVEVSEAINNHKEIDFTRIISNTKDFLKKDFAFIEASSLDKVDEYLLEIVEELINKGEKFETFQILTPTNKGNIGTIKINEEIQKKFNSSENYLNINANAILKENDKIIHIINDYDLQVMNGSIGFITKIFETNIDECSLNVYFKEDEKEVSYAFKNIDEIKLAYAITIHKSQGSEFPITIIPLHKSQLSVLNLNLLYTAITRARKNIIIIGDIETFKKALEVEATNRNSGLIERLN